MELSRLRRFFPEVESVVLNDKSQDTGAKSSGLT
jgi:hypothetical protein